MLVEPSECPFSGIRVAAQVGPQSGKEPSMTDNPVRNSCLRPVEMTGKGARELE